MVYIGVTLLNYAECEVWRMTPYKILRLFSIHKAFNPDKFKQEKPRPQDPAAPLDDIDKALGGF